MRTRRALPSLLLIAAASSCPACAAPPPSCEQVYEDRDWTRVARLCDGWWHRDHRRLGAAWTTSAEGDAEGKLVDELRASPLVFDAVALAGYAHRAASTPADGERAVALLTRAAIGHAMLGRRAAAAHDAAMLSRLPRTTMRLGDAQRWAAWSVAEADASGNRLARGVAYLALAEVEDDLGLAEEARDAFFHSAEYTRPWQDRLAWTYLKHGMFLLDLGGPADLRSALRYLDAATEAAHRAYRASTPLLHKLLFAVELNRADALVQLGDLDEAERALTIAPRPGGEAEKAALVRGYIAARRGDLAAAEARFGEAEVGDAVYRARVAFEIASLHHRAGRASAAEASYREALAAIEAIRRDAGGVELRPSILARWSRPYVGLLQLLVEEGRGADALVVAESLHARSWLDSVRGGRTVGDAVRDAEVQAEVAIAPLERDALLALVGAREAVVLTAAGGEVWRAHVRGGQVVTVRLTAEQRAAVTAFARDPSDRAVAAQAGDALIPAEVSVGDAPLYVVASGHLATLPFAALLRGERYLVTDRPLARLPGLATLACRPRTWTGRRVFIGDAQGNLTHAAEEVRELGGEAALLGSAATRASLLGAGDAALLHVAVHGGLTASRAALHLADGLVTPADILEGGVAPEVVVLTGCDTGVGRDPEDWDGFPSAFLAAGSRRVVATLRLVDDGEAAAFVARYAAASAELDPIQRLAAVQRDVAASGALPVAAWSSFAVWGVAECEVGPAAALSRH